MMRISMGPTGQLIAGTVLDVNVKAFDETLKHYDPLLYVKWNPNKLRGWGCWEIRRKPSKKTAVYQGTHKDVPFFELKHVEYQTVHHVLDCAYLNYDAIRKLKEMDTFNKDHWIHNLEAREEAQAEAAREAALKDMKYALRQNRSAARDLKEMVASGINPAQIMTSIKWD